MGVELAEARRAFRHAFRRAACTGSPARTIRTARPTRSRPRISSARSTSSTARRRPRPNHDFLLTVDGVKAWEKKHGDIKAGEWVLMRTDWYKRNGSRSRIPQCRREGPAFARPDGRSDPISDQQGHRSGWGSRDDRHRCRLGRRHGTAIPRAHLDAQGQPLRPRQPVQSRPAAAEGRDPDRRAAQDRPRHRQPGPRAGARGKGLLKLSHGAAEAA